MSAVIVANCPRCRARNMTFDVLQAAPMQAVNEWQHRFEAFCMCRNCRVSTTFAIAQEDYHVESRIVQAPVSINGSLNDYFKVEGFICLKDVGAMAPPEFVDEPIAGAIREGATCVVTNCPNAAGTMFRLVVDLTTRPLLPPEGADAPGLTSKVRRDLGLRLPWLFDNGFLPRELRELSHCIREDGNDGAHAGTLTMEDALDLQDFTAALLERVFTEPARLKLAEKRRAGARRSRVPRARRSETDGNRRITRWQTNKTRRISARARSRSCRRTCLGSHGPRSIAACRSIRSTTGRS
jgi:Domain of unknown function (DUF4145)